MCPVSSAPNPPPGTTQSMMSICRLLMICAAMLVASLNPMSNASELTINDGQVSTVTNLSLRPNERLFVRNVGCDESR